MSRIPPVRRLLMDAQKLISKEENWTKHELARGAAVHSIGVDIFGPGGRRFCSLGAIWRANYERQGSGYDGYKVLHEAISVLENSLVSHAELSLTMFNDAPTTTHHMVMRLFNKAIRRAKEQGI